jgi:hypothetical protein
MSPDYGQMSKQNNFENNKNVKNYAETQKTQKVICPSILTYSFIDFILQNNQTSKLKFSYLTVQFES